MISVSIYLAHFGIWVPCYAPHIPGGEYAVTGLTLTREIGKADTLKLTLPPTNVVRGYNGSNDYTVLYEYERDTWASGTTELQLRYVVTPLLPGLSLKIGNYTYVVTDVGQMEDGLQAVTISPGLQEAVENWADVDVIESITPLQTSVAVRDGAEILFYGRVLSINRDLYDNMELVCEGGLAFLNDSIIAPNDTSIYSYSSSTKTGSYSGAAETYVENVLTAHNGQVGSDRQIQMGHVSDSPADETDGTVPYAGYTVNGTYYTIEQLARQVINGSWSSGATRRRRLENAGICYELVQNKVNELLGYSNRFPLPASAYTNGTVTSALVDVSVTDYKTAWDTLQADGITDTGYTLVARAEEVNGEIVVYLDMLSREGSQGEQEIAFGRNILDLDEYIDAADVYTRVIPLGKNGLTISSVNSGAIFLENTTLSAVYGQITKVIQHTDVSAAKQLKAAGEEDLKAMLSAAISLTIKAVDLTITGDASEAFYVGGWNRVYSPPHGYDEYLQCTRIVRNLQDPGKDEFTFGATRNGVSATVAALAAGK